MEKRIKDFEDYGITDDGQVISYKYKIPRIMATYFQASGYENVKLCMNNKTVHKLIHRLVAEAFIPNPNNLLEVNHKDLNPKNNKVENLEWCDRKTNLELSGCGFTRNFFRCYLEKVDSKEIIREFESIKSACEWAGENLGCSKSYLQRKTGNISNGYRVVKRCRD